MKLPPSYKLSIGSIFSKLSILMAAVSATKVALDVVHLQLTAFLQNVLKTYVVVFHTIFDVCFFWLPFYVPGFVKDLTVIYIMVGGAAARAVFVVIEADYRHPWIVMTLFRNSKLRFFLNAFLRVIGATIGWPIWLWQKAASPHLVMPSGSHGPGRISYQAKNPGSMTGPFRNFYYGDVRWIVAIRLVSIISATIAILVINYAFSI